MCTSADKWTVVVFGLVVPANYEYLPEMSIVRSIYEWLSMTSKTGLAIRQQYVIGNLWGACAVASFSNYRVSTPPSDVSTQCCGKGKVPSC